MTVPIRPTICHVLHSLNVGGAELLARDYALNGLDKYHPVFVCLDEIGDIGDQLKNDGFTVVCLGRRNGFDRSLPRRIAELCRQHEIDIIHAYQYTPFFYASLSRGLTHRRLPVIFNEHGRHHPDKRSLKRVIANKLLLGPWDSVVAVGQDVKRALIQNEGLPPERIQVFYNGVDTEHFQPPRELKSQTRQKLNLSKDAFLVVQIARLNALKDHKTAVEAISRIDDANVQLVVVGDGETKEDLVRQISHLKLQDRVHLVGQKHNVVEYLHAADAFWLTSISEGIPLTLIEAMATRLPCISTRVGGISEIVEHEHNGLLAKPGDADSIANQLRRLQHEPELRKLLAENGHHRATTSFSKENMHRSYQNLYEALLRSQRNNVARHSLTKIGALVYKSSESSGA